MSEEKEQNLEEATEENNEEVNNVEELKASEPEVVTEEKKEEEVEEDFKSKYYYIAAEMENLKRRNERERSNLLKFGNEKILSSLVDVVDNFDRSIDALEKELDKDEDEKIKNIVTGVDMVRKQLAEVLTKNGLEIVKAVGEIFDPNFHEAMAQQPAEGKEDQEIIIEFQKGYMLNGRLLRAAKVIVAKND